MSSGSPNASRISATFPRNRLQSWPGISRAWPSVWVAAGSSITVSDIVVAPSWSGGECDEREADGDRRVLRGEADVVEDPERRERRRAADEAVGEAVLRRVDELVEAPRPAAARRHR